MSDHRLGSHGKAVRIEIEWEDGTVQTLSGEPAQEYIDLEKNLSVNAWNHGWKIPAFPWAYTEPTKELPPEEQETGRVRAKYICSICKEPQRATPSGLVCKNGHGGAPADVELDIPDDGGEEPEC